MATGDVDMDPTAVEAAAGRLRQSGSLVEQHGNTLDTATSAAKIGRGGSLAKAVEDLAKRGLGAVARDVTQAVKRAYDDTATGLERAAKRTRTQDSSASHSFDSLGHSPPTIASGSPISVGGHGGHGGPSGHGPGGSHGSGPAGLGGSGHGAPPIAGPSGGRGRSPSPIPFSQGTKPKHSPSIKKWQAAGGTVTYRRDGSVKYTTGSGHHDKLPANRKDTSVTYDKRGNPDFGNFRTHSSGVQQVTFEDNFKGNHDSDFRDSNTKAAEIAKANDKPWDTKGNQSPANYTWHHYHDLETMQLVERPVHQLFSHQGGVAMLKAATRGAAAKGKKQ